MRRSSSTDRDPLWSSPRHTRLDLPSEEVDRRSVLYRRPELHLKDRGLARRLTIWLPELHESGNVRRATTMGTMISPILGSGHAGLAPVDASADVAEGTPRMNYRRAVNELLRCTRIRSRVWSKHLSIDSYIGYPCEHNTRSTTLLMISSLGRKNPRRSD